MSNWIVADACPPQPWRNGGGVTRELLTWPSAADWQWRLSLADIERDGPFSAFPGVQRHFAVLSGGGVALQLPEGEQRLHAGGPPLAFDGALAPACRLLAGPTRDLNLMLRGVAGALQRLLPGSDWTPPAAATWRALFSIHGGRLQGPDRLDEALPPGSLRPALPPGPLRWAGDGPAYGIWVQVPR